LRGVCCPQNEAELAQTAFEQCKKNSGQKVREYTIEFNTMYERCVRLNMPATQQTLRYQFITGLPSKIVSRLRELTRFHELDISELVWHAEAIEEAQTKSTDVSLSMMQSSLQKQISKLKAEFCSGDAFVEDDGELSGTDDGLSETCNCSISAVSI
jgi:hypothetical protein